MVSGGWTVETLGAVVDAELDRLPADMLARFRRIAGLIEAHGPQRVGMPHIRPLEGKLWEIRMTGRDGIARAIYLAAAGRRLVVLHAFTKKTDRTPRRSIGLAARRAKEAGLL